MKKILLLILLFVFRFSYAGTGSARDEVLFVSILVSILLLILGLLYLIKTIRKLISKYKVKQLINPEIDNDKITVDKNLINEDTNLKEDNI